MSQRRKRLLDVGGRPFELARIGIFLIVANRGEEGNEKNSAKWFVRSDIMGNVCMYRLLRFLEAERIIVCI